MKAFVGCLLVIGLGSLSARAETRTGWVSTTWQSEPAYAAVSGGWRAVVSISRGRLISFGRDDGPNLLFAPATCGDPVGWGGHRVWLGPQSEWESGGWPPPGGWETSAAAEARLDGDRLVLTMPAAGHGWPSLVREYFWGEDGLHCSARIAGGTHPTQIIHIMQVPSAAVVTAQRAPTAARPRGYVQLHLGRPRSPQAVFAQPPHARESADAVELRFVDIREKLGFMPQTLRAKLDSTELRLSPGKTEGQSAMTPDDGFTTQIYLGGGDTPLIELEQLSPRFVAGTAASFEVVLQAGGS